MLINIKNEFHSIHSIFSTMNSQATKNDQIIIGSEVISRSALEQDVKTLMISYQKKQAYDFNSFIDVWKERTFSLG